jgi:hypothetical protein
MGRIMGIALMGLLAALAAAEIMRFVRAGQDPEALAYPRRRLSRRLAIALLFVVLTGLLTFWPRVAPWTQLALLVATLTGMAVGLFLLWRDLRETSLAVVAESSRLTREAGGSLSGLFERDGGGALRIKPEAATRDKDNVKRS